MSLSDTDATPLRRRSGPRTITLEQARERGIL
jgi:hypothetical protein